MKLKNLNILLERHTVISEVINILESIENDGSYSMEDVKHDLVEFLLQMGFVSETLLIDKGEDIDESIVSN